MLGKAQKSSKEQLGLCHGTHSFCPLLRGALTSAGSVKSLIAIMNQLLRKDERIQSTG